MTSVATVLEIDLDVIAANWRLLRGLNQPGETAAVVKADGYGLGAAPIVRRLHEAGCRHFFTAHLEEARGGARVGSKRRRRSAAEAEKMRADILAKRSKGVSAAKLAEKYGVSTAYIYMIK